jgi:hypothetical protein
MWIRAIFIDRDLKIETPISACVFQARNAV